VSLRLRIAEIHLPRRLRRRRFEALVSLTAEALGAEAPLLQGLSDAEALTAFARFTAGLAGRISEDGKASSEAGKRLRDAAFALGRDLRRELGVRSAAEVMRAARILYRALGIDLRGSAAGEIEIRSCFFAAHYSPRACALISALDEGVLAGLAGGGSLAFTKRITEDNPCCRARFFFPAEPS
jgi:hypothetical protein